MTYSKESRTITKEEWLKEGELLFGLNKRRWLFRCPNCGALQCFDDFRKLGIDKPEDKVYFSCLGRWVVGCKGDIHNKLSPCDYTNGGSTNLSTLKVINDDETVYIFEFATPEDIR